MTTAPEARTRPQSTGWLRRGRLWAVQVPEALWPTLVVASVFGPYVIGGMRTEQLAVYGLAAVLLWPMVRFAAQRPSGLWPVLGLWLVPVFIAAVGAFFAHTPPEGYELGDSVLAGMDNLLLPVALIGLAGYWLSRANGGGLLRWVATAAVGLMSANAFVAILQLAGILTGGTVLSAFWSESPDSVALLALQHERFTGIFNQPAEAGLAYAVALFLLTYLWMSIARPVSRILCLVSLLLLMIGSYLTVSKMVLIMGVPWLVFLLLVKAWRSRPVLVWLLLVLLVFTSVGAVLMFPLGDSWTGAALLRDWADSLLPGSDGGPTTDGGSGTGSGTSTVVGPGVSDGLLETLTAARYGEGGLIAVWAGPILESGGWFGFGAAGVKVPYDSAPLELLAVSGLVGLAAYGALLLYLMVAWWRRRRGMLPALWMLSLGAVGLVIGGSVGIPPLTVNRSSTLLWLSLLLALFSTEKELSAGRSKPGVPALDP